MDETTQPDQTADESQVETAENESVAGKVEPSIESLTEQVAKAELEALRAQAELENFRKRARREIDDERKYAASGLIKDLLAVVDNVQRAIEAAEQGGDSSGMLEGFRLVGTSLADTLKRHGCQRIEAANAEFDPNLHEAILQQPSSDVPSGHVLQVAQEGYTLHDRVLRPAQVVVATAPE